MKSTRLIYAVSQKPLCESSDCKGSMGITVLLVVAQLSKGLTPAVVGFKYGVEAEAVDASFFEGDVSVYFAGKTDWFYAW